MAMTNEALSFEDGCDDLSGAKIKKLSLKSVENISNLAKEVEEYDL